MTEEHRLLTTKRTRAVFLGQWVWSHQDEGAWQMVYYGLLHLTLPSFYPGTLPEAVYPPGPRPWGGQRSIPKVLMSVTHPEGALSGLYIVGIITILLNLDFLPSILLSLSFPPCPSSPLPFSSFLSFQHKALLNPSWPQTHCVTLCNSPELFDSSTSISQVLG